MRLTALLLFVAAGVAHAEDRPIPKYEGKTLEEWVAKLEHPADEKERDEATKALCAFGKDAAPAIPKLLVMLEDKSAEYRQRVGAVFHSIGEAAKPAVPTLVKRLKEGQCADPEGLIAVLKFIGSGAKEAIPVLVKLVTDSRFEVSIAAMSALCAIGPDAAKDGMPVIIAAARANKEISFYVRSDIPKFKSAAVPGLLELIEKPTAQLDQSEVVRVLEWMKADAKAAVPTLKKLLPTADELKAEQTALEEERKAEKKRIEEALTARQDRANQKPLTPDEEEAAERVRQTKRAESEKRYLARRATIAVARIEPCPEVVGPLIAWLKMHNEDTEVADVLGELGAIATDALPVLKEKLTAMTERTSPKNTYREAIRQITEAQKKK